DGVLTEHVTASDKGTGTVHDSAHHRHLGGRCADDNCCTDGPTHDTCIYDAASNDWLVPADRP
ncbi:MAG: hypothetical protein ABMA25_12000, partial [Ilumatobacteraceae bacterium]